MVRREKSNYVIQSVSHALDVLEQFYGSADEIGVPRDFARSFALLAFATFIYDTLDVATRLGRYVFQELTGWKGRWGGVAATLATLALPALSVSWTVRDLSGNIVPAWKLFWTLFGTSNQLLAALTLLTITVWLKRTRRPWLISALPAAFMLTITFWSLTLTVRPWLAGLFAGQVSLDWIALIALVLMALAVLVLLEALKAFTRPAASEI